MNTVKNASGDEAALAGCFDDYSLFRYYEKSVAESEAHAIEQHLVACETCLGVLAAMERNSHRTMSETAKAEVAQACALTPATQVAKIIKYVEAERQPKSESGVFAVIQNTWEAIKAWIDNLGFGFGKRWRPALVWSGILLIFFFLAWPQYLSWRSKDLTASGIAALAENYSITARDEPRPVGGFQYEEFGRTRGGVNNSIYEPARANIEKALQLNRKNLSAHHYLGTYYLLIEKDFDKAKAQYLLALAQDSTNASLLNDLGVASFYQGAYDEAVEQFSRALQYNSHLIEAQYNLATLYQNQGRKAEAMREWAKYLELDPTLKWSKVARSRLELLQQTQ